MRVERAHPDDVPAWLRLAAEVEPLFGPMANEPRFRGALERAIARESAWCVRDPEAAVGAPLTGAVILDSRSAPHYEIDWLAVTARARGRGLGRALVRHCLALAKPPAEVRVVTFGADVAGGQPARGLYAAFGFAAAEPAPNGPEGGSRQVFRLVL